MAPSHLFISLKGMIVMAQKKSAVMQPVLERLRAFRAEVEAVDWSLGGVLEDDRRRFVLLLSGLSSCRMSPGIPQNMGHETLYVCADAAAQNELRAHLKSMYGITDEASLWESLNYWYQSYDEYDTFRTFWVGKPEFDLQSLNRDGRYAFEDSMRFAALLRDIVGNNGFLAWDVNERLGMCRRAYAAGLITEERFWEAAAEMSLMAAAYYDNWGEYALSCLCSSVYFAYRLMYEHNEAETAASPFLGIQLQLLRGLIAEDGLWRNYGWPTYRAVNKKYALSAKDLILLLPAWDGPRACLATDRIMVEGLPVGYMYRETASNSADSGWRFTAGDESDEYINNPDNTGFYDLNTVCNSDPEIIELLDAAPGSAFVRINGGPLQPVD